MMEVVFQLKNQNEPIGKTVKLQELPSHQSGPTRQNKKA